MRRMILLILTAFLLIFIVSAAPIQELPAQKKNNCVDLPQTCATCSFVTLESVQYPNSSIKIVNQNMTKQGLGQFNYTFCDTQNLGEYIVTTHLNGNVTAPYSFEVTSDGFDNLFGLHMIFLLIVGGLVVLGVAIQDVNITAIGNLGMYYLGIYFIVYGINNFTSIYVQAFGGLILATAFYVSWKVYEGYTEGTVLQIN